VAGVFFGYDYVSVTRSPSGPDWAVMKAPVLAAIMDHFVSGAPLLRDGSTVAASAAGEDTEIVLEIKQLLDSRVRPAVAQDGGDILFDAFDEATGVLTLRMRGACAGCPSSTATLKSGVEQMMKHYIPEVTSVEQVI
jgi:Fe-S cluster biogenesis protein NfuA